MVSITDAAVVGPEVVAVATLSPKAEAGKRAKVVEATAPEVADGGLVPDVVVAAAVVDVDEVPTTATGGCNPSILAIAKEVEATEVSNEAAEC